MKLITMLMLLSAFSFAQSLYPRLVTFPNQVQLSINNYTDKDQRCSGSVFIYHQSGRFESRFYSSTIYRGMSDYEYYYNFNNQDPYRNAHHSIRCYGY